MKFHDLESPEKWIAALDDDRFALRSGALMVLAECLDPPVQAVAPALRQVDRLGWHAAFDFPHMIAELPHTEESFQWLVRRLHSLAPQAGVENELMHLSGWFCKAPVAMLERHIDDFVETFIAAPGSGGGTIRSNPLVFRSPGASFATAANRLHFRYRSSQSLTTRADELLGLCATHDTFPKTEVRELGLIAQTLAARGECPCEAAGEWLDTGPLTPDSVDGEGEYRAGYALMLLTAARVAAPLDKLLNLLAMDWDWMNELYHDAMAAAADAARIAELLAVYPGLEWYQRLFSSGVIEDCWQPENEQAVIETARNEQDHDIRAGLAASLVLRGSREAREFALSVAEEKPGDPERMPIWEFDVIRETVCGRETHATRARLAAMESQSLCLKERLGSFDHAAPPPPSGKLLPFAGRNDPCPCGSGKKFKKCCLK